MGKAFQNGANWKTDMSIGSHWKINQQAVQRRVPIQFRIGNRDEYETLSKENLTKMTKKGSKTTQTREPRLIWDPSERKLEESTKEVFWNSADLGNYTIMGSVWKIIG